MKQLFLNLLFSIYAVRLTLVRKIVLKIVKKIDGGQYWSVTLRKIYKKYHKISVGIGSYGGCFDIKTIPPGTEFGKYCSVAGKIYIFNANHPEEFITTHPMTYNPSLNFVSKEYIKRSNIKIGNDVWIGQNVIITSKVKRIGDGAIIGAGAVVTKDVEPFSVVGGIPARLIKKRFTPEQMEKIEESKWWDLDLNVIRDHISLFKNIANIDFFMDLKKTK